MGETRRPRLTPLALRAAGKMCRCGCCGVLTVVVILMFAASWSSLDFQEFGLDYNSIRQTVNPIADGSGRYFLGVGHSFLIFPKVYQTIEYSQAEGRTGPPVQSRTKDGVEVILSVSFQYQLQRESIYDLFTTYGLNIDGESADGSDAEIEPYRKVFSYVARDILTDVSTEYNAFEFFSNRTNIGDRMWQELRRTFEEDYFSTVAFFQLKDVDLPDEFEHAIQDAEVSRQYQQRAREIQTRLLIEAETSVIQVIPPIGAEVLNRRPPAGPCRLFLGPGFRLAARWNRLGETVKTRKKREKTGKKWARYGLKRVKVGS